MAIPMVVLAITFEVLARTIPTTYSTKHLNLLKRKSQIEILVTGPSHSNFGINPKYFGRESFNISNTSQGLYQDYKVLLRYLPECKSVKMVIIPISYFSLFYDMASSPEAWRCAYYPFYMGVQGDTTASVGVRNYSALVLFGGPMEVIKNTLKNMFHINAMDINEYGCQSPAKEKKPICEIINDNTGKARVAFHDSIMKSNLLGDNIAALDGIAKELTKRKIQIVFVVTPVYKTYSRYISKKNYQLMTAIIANISRKYSAKSYNYFYDSRFKLNDFADNDHLNENGATKFSILLKNEVIDKLIKIS